MQLICANFGEIDVSLYVMTDEHQSSVRKYILVFYLIAHLPSPSMATKDNSTFLKPNMAEKLNMLNIRLLVKNKQGICQ